MVSYVFPLKIFFNVLAMADLMQCYRNACVARLLVEQSSSGSLQIPQQCKDLFTACSLFLVPLLVGSLPACSPHACNVLTDIVGKGVICRLSETAS